MQEKQRLMQKEIKKKHALFISLLQISLFCCKIVREQSTIRQAVFLFYFDYLFIFYSHIFSLQCRHNFNIVKMQNKFPMKVKVLKYKTKFLKSVFALGRYTLSVSPPPILIIDQVLTSCKKKKKNFFAIC